MASGERWWELSDDELTVALIEHGCEQQRAQRLVRFRDTERAAEDIDLELGR